MPLGISRAPVTVIVQLAGETVAEQQGNAGRKLDRAEKERIKGELRARQEGVRGGIEALGGSVRASYQSAYNGLKVSIARDRVADLAAQPGVVAVRPVRVLSPANVRAVPLIGAPTVWQSLGLHGEGVKIAIIDSGIDYTHATFAGPGTAADFALAFASNTAPAHPALFGPAAPRIKGGVDLVGDDFWASAPPLPDGSPNPRTIPHPDPNPLDCSGHGTLVAGTAAGSGVTSTGATYTGPFDAATLANPSNFSIGPGVAPKADLYAVRVFGCEGNTRADVMVDAIEWAVDNDMDVINMSIASVHGAKDDPDAVASTNAAKAGVIVVALSGNQGPNQYLTASPGSADGAISAQANDAWPTLQFATLTLPSGGPIQAIIANGAVLSGSANYQVKVIRDDPATPADESLGCAAAHFGAPLGPNTIAVVYRGLCARIAKAVFGQQAGFAAVVMVNNAAGLPPFEGPIFFNPEDGTPFNVTIPFLGVAGGEKRPLPPTSDGGRLFAVPDGFVTAVSPILNGNYTGLVGGSSGPRTGDSALKPDVTAPGLNILTALVGTGNAGLMIGGTSLAAPQIAGIAALVRQARPGWKVEDIKSAIVNTARPSGIAPPGPGGVPYRTSLAGAGLVQAAAATTTRVVARASGGRFETALNFGFEELRKDLVKTKSISLRNHGSSAATFAVTQTDIAGSPHAVSFSRTTVTVPARGSAEVNVTLKVPAASAGASNGTGLSFQEVAGVVTLTPSGIDNAGVTLRVPYYLVPRASAGVSTRLGRFSGGAARATVTNKRGVIAGDADFYAWGLFAGRGRKGEIDTADVRAVGVQSFEWDATQQLLVFAVNGYNRWSNACMNEFDIYVDVDGDGTDDYVVVGVDQGAVQFGSRNGAMGSFVFSLRSPDVSINFLAVAPSDSSTLLLPVLSSQLCVAGEPCLNASNPRITYRIEGFDFFGSKIVPGSARFNPWSNSISTGGFARVAPGASDSTTVISVNAAEAALTPARGLLVVTFDNESGADEAQLIEVGKDD
jgi:subtilisin family serine protease